MSIRARITSLIILLIFIGGIVYLALPVLNYGFYGWPLIFMIFGLSILIISDQRDKKINLPGLFGLIALILGAVFFIIIPLVLTPQIWRAKKYQSIIGVVSESKFTTDISPVDIDRIRLVDRSMASRLGDKTIGQDPALGSSFKVGEFSIQTYKGELYWVAPLMHRSFFKWLGNRDGARGYILVSATDPQDISLVQSEGYIKYSMSAFLSQDLKRHLWANGFHGIGFTDYSFEIDDTGKPFWVVTEYRKQVGYSGKDAVGTIVVDAYTGEIGRYPVKDTPKWVDRIQPESFIAAQINDWGKYKKGFWNAVFSEEGVLTLTPGISLVYGRDGSSYWYSGLTSSGGDDSTVGFVLINTRTKETRYYKQAGATETAAMSSAEGRVQEKGYRATFPIMYNILGKPTYIMSLKDKAGLIKMISMVSVEDYTILGIGETTEEALRNYRTNLKKTLSKEDIRESISIVEESGSVTRINSDIFKGNSFYYFTVDSNNYVYTLTSQVSRDIILTSVGDNIVFEYEESDNQPFEVSKFLNKTIK